MEFFPTILISLRGIWGWGKDDVRLSVAMAPQQQRKTNGVYVSCYGNEPRVRRQGFEIVTPIMGLKK
ncbi:hypothetical protein PanWU01x14_224620, partial [Parasponia andersonii]